MKTVLSANTIRRRWAEEDRALRVAEAKHTAALKELFERCPHDWQYHPDPSGNNDSGYMCALCHDCRKRLP